MDPLKEVMLDLETMGVGPTAAIISIGACKFDLSESQIDTGARYDTFYTRVSLESSVKAGLTIDASTERWWSQQSEAARKATFEGESQDLYDALYAFGIWLTDIREEDRRIWGNGATFDNVIIRSAYRAVGLEAPWSFRNDRCYRTVVNLLPLNRQPQFERSGTAHNALDDAITQATHLQKVWKALGL